MTDEALKPASSKGRGALAAGALVLVLAIVWWLAGDTFWLWIKALHVIAVISWMAGMLYLPRLFIYHLETEIGSEGSERFKVMEQRLLKVIINPAMMVTWLAGLYLAWTLSVWTDIWFLVKFVAVFALSGLHGHFSKAVKAFAADERLKDQRYWRLMNEGPTVLMIVIVIMVIVKPFG